MIEQDECWICFQRLSGPVWEHSSGLVKMHLNCQDVLTEVLVSSAQGVYTNTRMMALFLAEAAQDSVVKVNNGRE